MLPFYPWWHYINVIIPQRRGSPSPVGGSAEQVSRKKYTAGLEIPVPAACLKLGPKIPQHQYVL
jgi:hypothetical protein